MIQAYCLSETTTKSRRELEYGCYSEYWIGFYDVDAKHYPGKIRLICSSHGGMCNYRFKRFFDPIEIESEADMEIQEKLLTRINWMLDEGILMIDR